MRNRYRLSLAAVAVDFLLAIFHITQVSLSMHPKVPSKHTFASVGSAEEVIPTRVLKAYYIGGQGHDNLGDDLMYEIAVNTISSEFARMGASVVLIPLHPYSPCLSQTLSFSEADFVVLGGGSLLNEDWLCPLFEPLQRHGAELPLLLFGTGYDDHQMETSNPDWLLSVRSLSAAHKISANDAPYINALQHYKQRYGGVRGPYTELVLNKAYPTIGDSGLLAASHFPNPFATNPESSARNSLLSWLSQQTQRAVVPDTEFVLINYGRPIEFNRLYGSNQDAVLMLYANLVVELIRVQRKSVIIYPVYQYDIHALMDLKNVIESTLQDDPSNEKYLHVLYTVPDVGYVLELAKISVYTVNFKLHATVLSAAAAVPFISTAYRFKCIEFADSVGMHDYVIPLNEATHQKIIMMATQISQRRKEIVQVLQESIQNASKNYADTMEAFSQGILNLASPDKPQSLDRKTSSHTNVLKGAYLDINRGTDAEPMIAFELVHQLLSHSFAKRGVSISLTPFIAYNWDGFKRQPNLYDFAVIGSSGLLADYHVLQYAQPFLEKPWSILLWGTGVHDPTIKPQVLTHIRKEQFTLKIAPQQAKFFEKISGLLRGPLTKIFWNKLSSQVDVAGKVDVQIPLLASARILTLANETSTLSQAIRWDIKSPFVVFIYAKPEAGFIDDPSAAYLTFAQLVISFAETSNHNLLIMAVEQRSILELGQFYNLLVNGLSNDARARVHVMASLLDSAYLLPLLSRAEFAFGIGHQSAILSASSYLPTIVLQNNIQDVDACESLGISPIAIRIDRLSTKTFDTAVQKTISLKSSIRARLHYLSKVAQAKVETTVDAFVSSLLETI
eukprot:TRINITY_DN7617_c0_g1_i2.p1 TRINITY_DN7617_c0_g1~~TRINITY_DN7617_c0_g1_i2.p1  ORF type:complete len:845 (+),score=169.20 TRINITY_DN7617_c0_g1_i2:44-2578(+)